MDRYEMREKRIYADPGLPAALYRLHGSGRRIGTSGLSSPSRRPPGSSRFESVKKSLAIIHGEYAGRLTVPRLAAAASLSEFHFYRVFREATGRSPVEYLNEYRCRRAAQLLSDTDAGVLGIALDVGFSSAAYFIRTFHRCFGCTPLTYRKRRKAGI
jgi:AraC-like DNA-binding protein